MVSPGLIELSPLFTSEYLVASLIALAEYRTGLNFISISLLLIV